MMGRAHTKYESRSWTPYSPAGRKQTLQHWQQQAASLNASFRGLAAQEEELRRSQRLAWKHDESNARKDAEAARIAALRGVIDFRESEREEAASTFIPIEQELARNEATAELNAREARRMARARSAPRWPERPATAPPRTPKVVPPPPPPRGRVPPREASAWSSGLGVRGGAMRTAHDRPMSQMPMWRQPAWRPPVHPGASPRTGPHRPATQRPKVSVAWA